MSLYALDGQHFSGLDKTTRQLLQNRRSGGLCDFCGVELPPVSPWDAIEGVKGLPRRHNASHGDIVGTQSCKLCGWVLLGDGLIGEEISVGVRSYQIFVSKHYKVAEFFCGTQYLGGAKKQSFGIPIDFEDEIVGEHLKEKLAKALGDLLIRSEAWGTLQRCETNSDQFFLEEDSAQ